MSAFRGMAGSQSERHAGCRVRLLSASPNRVETLLLKPAA